MRKSGVLVGVAVAVFGLTLVANEKPSDAFKKAMNDIQSGQMGLRAAVTAKDYDGIAKHAATFKASFGVTETYFTGKKVDDAVTAAKAGAKAAADLATAATAKNDENIAAAQRALGATCAGCHTAHRERLPDGTFEIK
jgi:mono/diheme cytochrome c family protein